MSKFLSHYVEFAIASNFSFLRGASHPEELILQAAHLGLTGIGLCDRNSVAGVVRAHVMRKEKEVTLRYHPGARLVFADGTPDILAYPRDRAAWGRLCRLLTTGNLRAEKGDCILTLDDLLEFIEGLELIVMPDCTRDTPAKPLHKSRTSFVNTVDRPGDSSACAKDAVLVSLPSTSGKKQGVLTAQSQAASAAKTLSTLARLREAAPGRVRLAAAMLYRGNDRARLAARATLAREAGVPLIAVNDVFYHHFERRELQDVLTCIREHVTIDAAGRRLSANAERYLKPAAEMARLFADAPEAIAETAALSDILCFSLDDLKYEYPEESVSGFASSQEALATLAFQGAARRYPNGIPEIITRNLNDELTLIRKLQYEPYFLTVYDIVRFARSQKILCQGRGSAANSTVCFCLGVTDVNPEKGDLLFERFISEDRGEPPDIDVDFEHERREEVIQYIYGKYGRARTGIAATVISYRGRSAIREVGKAFGLSEDMIGALASSIWGAGGGNVRTDVLERVGLDLSSSRVEKIIGLAKTIQGFPRHLSQHVGGFVITRERLDESAPILNGAMPDRTFVEWDKDDLDALNMLKVDVLGLGMLSCIRKAFDLIEKHYPDWDIEGASSRPTLATLPSEDPAVYDMLCRADSIGVFQVESRAQMSMLPRLRPRTFYDLVIEVAIVRPGPIQGDMVHPYLRRRQGIEPVTYLSDALVPVLGKTLGIPLFQEQAMRIAIVAGGFTPGEADKLRRAMATFKRTGTISTFRDKMIAGMVSRNIPREFAERCFNQIEGFGEYGFPESHAASFALLVYASAWLKCRYPDVFAAALLNAQPMGFYAPAQIVRDLREHGVEVRPVDVNFSHYDNTLEPGPPAAARLHPMHAAMQRDIRATHSVRLGMREIKGISQKDAGIIVEKRSGAVVTSPRKRGEVGAQNALGEGASQKVICAVITPHPNPLPASAEREQAACNDEDRTQSAKARPYASVHDLWRRTGLSPSVLERLADADAFGSLGLTRRQALWAVRALGRAGDQDDLPLQISTSPPAKGNCAQETEAATLTSPLPLRRGDREGARSRSLSSQSPPLPNIFPTSTHPGEPAVALPPMPPGEEVVNDYRFMRFSLRAHPASFLRPQLTALRIVRNEKLRIRRSGDYVRVSGLVTIRQRPGSANGVVFMTIEDESSIANIIVWPKTFERFRPVVLGARYICATGRLQSESGVIHVVADRLDDLTPMLSSLMQDAPPIEALARADEVRRQQSDPRHRPGVRERHAAFEQTIDVAADLGVSAPGSAHAPTRRATPRSHQ